MDEFLTIDRPPHGRIQTTDHGHLLKMDGGGRRTNTDRPPHGRIRTKDHLKFENVDGGGQLNRWTKIRPWRPDGKYPENVHSEVS